MNRPFFRRRQPASGSAPASGAAARRPRRAAGMSPLQAAANPGKSLPDVPAEGAGHRARGRARSPDKTVSRRLGYLAVLVALALPFLAWLALPLVPLPPALFAPPRQQVCLTDRHGVPLRTIPAAGDAFLRPAAYGEIPQALIHATLAAEDKRFWRHPGVDWRASLRAAWHLARYGRIVSGGSTITQQLVKLAQPRPRTFRAKLIEAVQALRLEQVWDKQRILREYLNRVDYGNLNLGCAAAADFYFAKPPRDLSPAECALLAGLPQAPTRLNPLSHPDRARKRRQWILHRMSENGFLTASEFQRAADEPLRLNPSARPFLAPHFVDLVLAQAPLPGNADLRSAVSQASGLPAPQSPERAPLPASHATSSDPQTGSLRPAPKAFGVRRPEVCVTSASGSLRTTLDLELNRVVERLVRRQIDRLAPQHVGDAAAVVIDNASGDVLALVGSRDFFAPRSGQVNGAWAPRSAGSTFKPFTYVIAFEQGATPASIVADIPAEFSTPTGLFSPANYDHHDHGPMRYRLALANSLNIAAVKVLASIGGPSVLQHRLQACGLTTLTNSPDQYGLGLTIGNAETRLLELANAYACLARLGAWKPYRLTAGSQPSDSSPLLFDPACCFLLADILSDNAARAPAFGPDSELRFSFPVACKTGTSSDFRDNWAFGYTPEFTVGIWAGNFDGSPMQGISGVTGAAPILHDIFEHLHQSRGTSWYRPPDGIVARLIHPVTGKCLARRQAGPGENGAVEKFVAGCLPPAESPADYDAQGRIRLPAEYRDWLATSDNWLAGRAVASDDPSALRILFPPPGATFYLDPDLPDDGRRVHLRAEGASAPEWRSDTLECRTNAGQTIALLTPGRHALEVRDPRTGRRRETWIQVFQR